MRLPKPSEGGDFLPVPAGTWPAICYSFVDLGTQDITFKGETQPKHQVRISWELHDDECIMREGPKAGQPMMIQQTYTWSMNEKANLRKALEAWRGKKFTDKEIGDFDVKNLLGQPCLLSVIHADKGEKIYANVGGITKPPKGMTLPSMVNKPIYIVLTPDEFDREAFAALPDYLKQKIMDSPEYHRLASGPREQAPSNYEKVLEDEIPF
jgi:hypothetical protein